MVPAVAVKVALVAPESTVTVAGTVRAVELLDSETETFPIGAELSDTEQFATPPDASEEGEQVREVSVTTLTITVAPVAAIARETPDEVLPSASLMPIEALRAEGVNATVTRATVPFCITSAFIPARMHLYSPALDVHASDLPAVTAFAPAVALIDATFAGA
jgi:hypothetical protein